MSDSVFSASRGRGRTAEGVSSLGNLLVVASATGRALAATLGNAGYDVIAVATAEEAMAALSDAPDMILLDLGPADRGGVELLTILAGRGRAGIMVLSSDDTAMAKVSALDRGAAAYLVAPCDTAELLARIRAVLRRRTSGEGRREVIVAGDVTIDTDIRRVTRSGSAIHLTPKEYAVLAELARFPGRPITHDHLLRSAWPRDRDHHMAYLRLVIHGMRRKLEIDAAAPKLICNVVGVGYKLNATASGAGRLLPHGDAG